MPRTARYFLAGEPGKHVTELWVACHGYGQLASAFAVPMSSVATPTRLVCVPEGLSRFYLDDPAKRHGPRSPVGASWMTREARESEIADHVRYLDLLVAECTRLCGGVSLRITGLGFSQGVATVARWAALGETKCDRLIFWAGTLPADLPVPRGAPFGGARIDLVAGKADPMISADAVEKAGASLRDAGARFEVSWFDGGHSLNTALLKQLAGHQ